MRDPDTTSAMMSRLLDCSHEVLHNILCFVQPPDLGALSRTCRSLNAFIRGNKVLCRELYLQRFDPPLNDSINQDWERDLRELVKLERMLSTSDEEYKRSCLASAVDTICSLVSSSNPSRNIDFLMKHFKSRANIDNLLTGSSIYKHAGTRLQIPAETPELRQKAAKLHVYFGIPVDEERASPPIMLPHPTTGPSYQVIHPDNDINHAAEPADGHFLRSKVRVEIPVNYIARAKVYDLREYTKHSLWGPFKGDGSLEVDWEKMEAIMILMGHNLRASLRLSKLKHTLWYGPWEGLSPGSFPSRHEDAMAKRDSAIEMPDCDDKRTEDEKRREEQLANLDAQDPYGISGTWLRVVCFLDYNDLYAFNFTNERRVTDQQRGIATDEAIRLICLKLKVARVVYPNKRGAEADDSDSSSDFDGDTITNPVSGRAYRIPTDQEQSHDSQANPTKRRRSSNPYSDRPIVYFTGVSRSLHASWDPNANSRIRGVVRTTPHGDVRWTTWSIFHGEERWRSECVQVGGAKSRRGVLGNWFDKDYDHYGPAGPTAFWKVSNEIETSERADGAGASNSLDLLRFLWRVGPTSDDEDDAEEEEEEDGEEEEAQEQEEWQDTDADDENTHVSVEVIDERMEEIEYEFAGTRQDLMDELEELRREAEAEAEHGVEE